MIKTQPGQSVTQFEIILYDRALNRSNYPTAKKRKRDELAEGINFL
jgi:hypothetical protein